MSDLFKKIACAMLAALAELAKHTQTEADDIAVKAMQAILKCGH